MKASFFERLTAYVIDIMIVSLIISLICSSLPINSENINEQVEKITEQKINGEISNIEYLKEYAKLEYSYEENNVIYISVNIIITFAYFIIFQYMNNGQTIGKKLLKLKVVNNKTDKPLKISQGILRTIFILSIFSSTLNLLLIYILNSNIYYIGYYSISLLESTFIIITIFFILYRKDQRGLHDLMTNSKVIKERK